MKVMTNLESVLKSRDITLQKKFCRGEAMVFPVVMYKCASWTIKKAEHRRIDAFKLWCWRRLLQVPWTPRSSNQSISTLNIHWKEWCWSWSSDTLATWCEELDHEESWAPKNWCFWTMVLEKMLRVPWTARRSNQSILKEISPEYSLETLML